MGSIQKQAIQNTVISYLGVIVGFINTLILQPRMLSLEELGLTRVLYSISVLIATLYPLGLNAFSVKYFPLFKNPTNGHNGYFGLLIRIALFGFILISGGVFLLKGTILSKYENAPLFIEYFYYIFPLSFFIGLNTVLNAYSSCLFKTALPSFLNEVYIRVAAMVVVSLYFLKIISFDFFVLLFMITFGVQTVLLLIYILSIDKVSFRVNWAFVKTFELKKTANYIILLSLATLASMAIRNNIDNILIGSFLDLKQVAIYSVAFLVASMIEVPAGALAKIADPKISDAISRNDFKLIKEVYFKSTRLLLIIGGLLFIGIVINITPFLSLLPSQYLAGRNTVIIIGISALSNMATGMNSSIIFYSDKYKQGSYMLIGLIVLSVILNIILIPIWGIEGAAIATATSLILSNLFKTIIIYRGYNLQPFSGYVIAVVGLIGISLVVNHFLPTLENSIFDMTYRSVLITTIYVAGIYFSGIANEATEFAKKLINR